MENGQVSRNECLQNFITRLGAIICKLKGRGWEFQAGYEKSNPTGFKESKDYVYSVLNTPLKKVVYKLPNGDIIHTKYEKK